MGTSFFERYLSDSRLSNEPRSLAFRVSCVCTCTCVRFSAQRGARTRAASAGRATGTLIGTSDGTAMPIN